MPAKATDWVAVEAQFVNCATPVREFATEHGFPLAGFRKRVERGGWLEKRRKASIAVAEVATAKLQKTKADLLAEFNEADMTASKILRGFGLAILSDAKKNERRPTHNELKVAADIIQSAQKIGRIALDATTENIGHTGIAGGAPILTAAASPEAVQAALNSYLHGF